MKVFKLIFKNSMRHKLRTALTVLGIAVAVMAFGLIRTFIGAWYSGARAASPDRLVTRHAASIIYELPLAYKEQLEKIDGVEAVTYAQWFGAYYVDPKNFFANFAIDHHTYLNLWSEFVVPPEQFEAFCQERRGAIIGRGTADRFGFKIGDVVPLVGTIFPGDWEFIVCGIYEGRDVDTDETAFLFRYDYLDETMRQESPGRAGLVGWYGLKIADPSQAAEVSAAIDARFDNSWAETKTETEKEFILGFIAMSGAIILGLRIVSYLIIGVILMVLVNTMTMTARERISENAFMRTIGFRDYHLVGLILGESLNIAFLGGLVGMGLLTVVANGVRPALAQFFPGFEASPETYTMAMGVSLLVGLVAAIVPVRRALTMRIVDGLRVVD